MGSCRIYCSGVVSTPSARLYLQEALLALLSLRPLLLRYNPQLCLHLVLSFQHGIIHGMLLPLAWIPCERSRHMEEQPCVS